MNIKGKKALVTGGAGFIGSHLGERLLELGARVTVVDNLSYGKRENLSKEAEFIELDVRHLDELKRVMLDKRPDIIYHLAANATTKESAMGWKNPIADYQINTLGTLNVLLAAADSKTSPLLVYASSAAAYGESVYLPVDEKHPTNPISPYGISKLTGEKYAYAFAHERGLMTACLRIFNTYGPRQPRYVMFDLMQKLARNPARLEVLGTGEQVRDYSYVTDTVEAFVRVAEKEAKNGTFNVAGGNPISIRELAGMVVRMFGLEGKTEIVFSGQSWPGDVIKWVADTSKIERELGFKPSVRLNEGLLKLYQWFKAGLASK